MSETLAGLDGSETARKRLLSIRGEPLFYADWDDVIFIHYQTDPQELQRCIPYHLDLMMGARLSASLHSPCVECVHDLADH